MEGQILKDTAVTVSYVGNHALGVRTRYQANPGLYVPGATTANLNSRRRYPGLGNLTLAGSFGRGYYNALQAQVTKRAARGLSLLVNYTWGKAMDVDSSGSFGTALGAGPRNPWDLSVDYSVADYDITQNFKAAAIYDLPEVRVGSAAIRRVMNGQEFDPDGRLNDRRQSLCWWEGPDGSRLLTMYSRAYWSGLEPPADWPYSTWMALMWTGDNAGPPKPESIEKLVADAKARFPGVRLSDFADALLAEKPALPIVRGDMPDPWIYGVMSMPIETALFRNTGPQIAALEALDTLLAIWTGRTERARTIAAAYEQSLLYGEHTWGYDAKRFPRTYGSQWEADRAAGKFARLEKSWEEHRDYARRAAEIAAPELERALQALSAAAPVSGRRVAVFNPLPWARSGAVEAPLDGPVQPIDLRGRPLAEKASLRGRCFGAAIRRWAPASFLLH